MNNSTKFYLCLYLLIVPYFSICAQPTLQWQKSYGGTYNDIFNAVLPTADGGMVACGTTYSFDGDVSSTTDQSGKVWLIKMDKTGAIVWQQSYGGFKSEEGNALAATSDGGYIICGSTSSTDVPGMHGIQLDIYVVKVDSVGKMEWHKAYGGAQPDQGFGICQVTDGGYVFTGRVYSNDGDVSGFKGVVDVWAVKLTSTGNITWQKTLGGSTTDQGFDIAATADGGCVIAGESFSKDGDLTKNNGGLDLWVVKLTNAGVKSWQRSYGGEAGDVGLKILETKDGEYLVAGCNAQYTKPPGGDITGNNGSSDAWVLKLRANGTILWNKTYGGSQRDTVRSIALAPDGTIVLAGTTTSNDSDVSNLHGTAPDVWVMQLGSDGTMLWNKTYGGTGIDIGRAVALTADSGVVVVGATASTDGDMAGNTLKGGYDTWVMKLGNVVSVHDVKPRADIKVYPTLTSRDVYITLPKNSKEKPAITLTDMQGRSISTEVQYGADKITVSVGNAAPGNYLLQLVYEGEQYVYKVVYR